VLDIFLAFTTGLLVSLHCVGMCGGFVAAYSLHLAGGPGGSSGMLAAFQPRLLWAHLLYNAGRLTTYTLLGGLMGLVGSFVGASGQLIGVQGLASILAGAFMILLGLNLGRWMPYVAWLQPVGVSRLGQLSDLGERLAGRANALGTYPLGLLLGLMPCGPLYAMEINAAGTGNVGQGMLTLLAFGLGTVPTLYAFGLVSTAVGHRLPRRFFQAAALVIVLVGVLTLLRGLAMNGLVPHLGLW
jgi:hypothetical protein